MPLRLLLIALIWGGLIGVHAVYKDRPDENEIQRVARRDAAPSRWVGRLAPDVSLPLLDGKTFRLSDEIGTHVVVLNFFATWCGPCKAEMPELARYQEKAGSSVRLIGIDAQETRAVVEPFLSALDVPFPVGIDDTGEILGRFEVNAFPTTIVIGADGRVKVYEVGQISNADVALGRAVAREQRVIAAGQGLTPETYRTLLAARPGGTDAVTVTPKTATPVLIGRAGRIAGAMACPCGCDDRLMACACRTAKQIKARLAEGDFGDRSDAAVMEALNQEFCMKGM